MTPLKRNWNRWSAQEPRHNEWPRNVESLDRQTTRPVAPDGDRRPRHVWHRRGASADRETEAEAAAPDADTRCGEEDPGYHSPNQATGRDAVDRANAGQTPARVAHDGASGLA